MAWKMSLACSVVSLAVAEGPTLLSVAVLTSDRDEVALVMERLGNGAEDGLSEVSSEVWIEPVTVLLRAVIVADSMAEVLSDVKELSSTVLSAGADMAVVMEEEVLLIVEVLVLWSELAGGDVGIIEELI